VADEKSDPTKDPEFQKVVRHFVTTPPKPHSEMKIGRRKAKTSTRMVSPFSDALEELALLLRQNGSPRDAVHSALRVFEHFDKCVVTKLQPMSAPITDDGGSAFQPSDLFGHYISAVRARDWPLVGVIEHEICSSSAEKRAPSA
jgi:hypothetical protein